MTSLPFLSTLLFLAPLVPMRGSLFLLPGTLVHLVIRADRRNLSFVLIAGEQDKKGSFRPLRQPRCSPAEGFPLRSSQIMARISGSVSCDLKLYARDTLAGGRAKLSARHLPKSWATAIW
jgi:hypothetical protein